MYRTVLLTALVAIWAGIAGAVGLGDDGLHKPDWLRELVEEAAARLRRHPELLADHQALVPVPAGSGSRGDHPAELLAEALSAH